MHSDASGVFHAVGRYNTEQEPLDKVIAWNRLSADYDIEFWPDDDNYPEYCFIELDEGRRMPVRPPRFEEVVYAHNTADENSLVRDISSDLLRYAEVSALEQASVYSHNGRVAYRDESSAGDDHIIYTQSLSHFLSLEEVAENFRTWDMMKDVVETMPGGNGEESERENLREDWEELSRMLSPFHVGRMGERDIFYENRGDEDIIYLLDEESRSLERPDAEAREMVLRGLES